MLTCTTHAAGLFIFQINLLHNVNGQLSTVSPMSWIVWTAFWRTYVRFRVVIDGQSDHSDKSAALSPRWERPALRENWAAVAIVGHLIDNTVPWVGNCLINTATYHVSCGDRPHVCAQKHLVVIVFVIVIHLEDSFGCPDDSGTILVYFDTPQTYMLCSRMQMNEHGNSIGKVVKPPPRTGTQCMGWSLMTWKIPSLTSHSRTASSSRGSRGLSESLDINRSTISSSKGNW